MREVSEQFTRACQKFLGGRLQYRFPAVLKQKKTVLFTHDQVDGMASVVQGEVVMSEQGLFNDLVEGLSLDAHKRAGFEQLLFQGFEWLSGIISVLVIELADLCSQPVCQKKLVSEIKKKAGVRLTCPKDGQEKKRDKKENLPGARRSFASVGELCCGCKTAAGMKRK